jgi:hypothetical protein
MFRVRGDLDDPGSVGEKWSEGKWQRTPITPMSLLGDSELGAKEVRLPVESRSHRR